MRTALTALVLVGALAACGGSDEPHLYPTVALTVRAADGTAAALTAEVVSTSSERQQGLMFRRSLPENEGMLFVFPAETSTGFWMRNTYIPLTIAYLAGDGVVLQLRTGEPLNETLLTPAQPYRYTLEVNEGWFERHGLGPGAQVILPPDLPAGE